MQRRTIRPAHGRLRRFISLGHASKGVAAVATENRGRTGLFGDMRDLTELNYRFIAGHAVGGDRRRASNSVQDKWGVVNIPLLDAEEQAALRRCGQLYPEASSGGKELPDRGEGAMADEAEIESDWSEAHQHFRLDAAPPPGCVRHAVYRPPDYSIFRRILRGALPVQRLKAFENALTSW
jgi:hypothetical protein